MCIVIVIATGNMYLYTIQWNLLWEYWKNLPMILGQPITAYLCIYIVCTKRVCVCELKRIGKQIIYVRTLQQAHSNFSLSYFFFHSISSPFDKWISFIIYIYTYFFSFCLLSIFRWKMYWFMGNFINLLTTWSIWIFFSHTLSPWLTSSVSILKPK